MYTWEIPRDIRVTPGGGLSHQFKYCFQLKTKERWEVGKEDSYGRLVNKGKICYADLNQSLFH